MEHEIRKLARSTAYQNLYNATKECASIQLFDNVYNFSGLQNLFLYWVSIYAQLYQELVTLEDKCLTEKVLLDDIRTDAYLIHRKNKHDYFWKNRRREDLLGEIQSKHPTMHQSGKTTVISTHFYREDKIKDK